MRHWPPADIMRACGWQQVSDPQRLEAWARLALLAPLAPGAARPPEPPLLEALAAYYARAEAPGGGARAERALPPLLARVLAASGRAAHPARAHAATRALLAEPATRQALREALARWPLAPKVPGPRGAKGGASGGAR